MLINAYAVWPRLLYRKGMIRLQMDDAVAAAGYFSRSLTLLPWPVALVSAAPDRFRIHQRIGEALYRDGTKQWKAEGLSPGAYEQLRRGKIHLLKAMKQEPGDYMTRYWLARAEAALETAFRTLNPGRVNPHDASVFFKQALLLRPSGFTIRYLYAGYLYQKGMLEALPDLVAEMAEISPKSYGDVRAAGFFNEALYPYLEKGLERAAENRFVGADAVKALSMLYWDTGRIQKALEVVKGAVATESASEDDLIYLGALMVAAGEKDKGFALFDRVLASSREQAAAADMIYGHFERRDNFDLFLEYSFHARSQKLVSDALDLNVARGLIRQGLLPFARARLVQVNARRENARAYELLAEICEAEGDWEGMAEMAGAGLVLAPENARLYYQLSVAYERLGKLSDAGSQAGKAFRLEPENKTYRMQKEKFESGHPDS